MGIGISFFTYSSSSILLLASIYHCNSLIKTFASLSISSALEAFPFSSNVLFTDATGNIAGTIHAFIFQNTNCSEVEKRKKYDELGENWNNYQPNAQGFNTARERNTTYSAGEQFNDGNFSDFFESVFGSSFGGAKQRTQQAYKGEDYNAEMQLSLEEAYSGTTRLIELNKLKLQLNIKPGVKEGQLLRMKGKGGKGSNLKQRQQLSRVSSTNF